MTPDPAGLLAVSLDNPQSLNRYTYVLNNPLQFVDPTGLDYCKLGLMPLLDVPEWQTDPQACSKAGGTWIIGNCSQSDGCPPVWSTGGGNNTGGNDNGGFSIFPPTGCHDVYVDGMYLGTSCPSLMAGEPGGGDRTNSGTKDIETLFRGFLTLAEPIDNIALNGMFFLGAGTLYFAGGSIFVAGCLEPTPAEPLTCAVSVPLSGATFAGGAVLTGGGVWYWKNVTAPSWKELWHTLHR